MLKDYLKERQISIYSLSKKTKIPYSSLSDLCNGKVNIDSCKVSILIQLSKELNIDINKLYEICKTNNEIKVEQYDTTGQLIVKNKKYYVQYIEDNQTKEIYLFKANTTNNQYVKETAKCLLEDELIEKEME